MVSEYHPSSPTTTTFSGSDSVSTQSVPFISENTSDLNMGELDLESGRPHGAERQEDERILGSSLLGH